MVGLASVLLGLLAAAPVLTAVEDTVRTPRHPVEVPRPTSFPVTVQFSPVPDGKGWKGEKTPLSDQTLRDTVDNLIAHGFTGLYHPLPLPKDRAQVVLDYAQSRGMFVTHITHGLELFGRDAPPATCVYSPQYAPQVRKAIEEQLGALKGLTNLYNVFCFQDEPFHGGAKSFGANDEVKAEFQKRYGYALPLDLGPIRSDPKVWGDVIEFRSSYFPDGWRQVYRIVKETNPSFRVLMTHDSHNTFGGGVGSNAEMAVDDVFHWGGDFADTFVFDVYPYMMFDFRYGEHGKLPKPRMSQFHYAMGQMRNLARAHGKQMGFWFGTCNPAWFEPFLSPEVRAQFWAERETSTTAVAQGADFLLTGYNVPDEPRHWEELGKGLRLIQKAGPALLDAPKVKARACFLFPRSQYVQLQEECWNVALSYELFQRSFGELDVLHEDQIRDDTLDGYRILVLCDVKLLPAKVADRIAAFVRKGGIVIADCVPQKDESRLPMDTMEQLCGVREAATERIKRTGNWVPYRTRPPMWAFEHDPAEDTAGPVRDTVRGRFLGQTVELNIVSPRPCRVTEGRTLLKTAAGRSAVVHRRVGKGQVFLLGFCLQDTYFQTYKDGDQPTRDHLSALLQAMTRKAGVRPHVSSSNPDIEASVRANAKEGFLFVINHESQDPRTTVRLADIDFPVARLLDLEDGREVPFTRKGGVLTLEIEVPFGITRLLHVLPIPPLE